MDGMNAYRRAQYITLISEIHCLPEMAPGNAIASLKRSFKTVCHS